MLQNLCVGWVSGQHIQLALNISSFTYYHVLASFCSLLLQTQAGSLFGSLWGKRDCTGSFPHGCVSLGLSPLWFIHQHHLSSVFWNLESVCFADGHSICSHSQLWIYKFLPVSFSPLSFHRELGLQRSRTH